MSTTRGRAIQVGGVDVTPGANSRVDANNLTRPAYRITSGVVQPIGGRLGPGHPLLDLSTVGGIRLLVVALAVAYVSGFHVTLGRARIGIGPAR